MANFNRVILVGNLTRDPEKRYTREGTAVTSFSLAINRFYKNRTTGEMKQQVDFIPVTSWGQQAETCEKYLKKGRSVLVEGSLVSSSWETPQGEKRSRLEVNAQKVQFLSPSGKNAGSGAAASSASSAEGEAMEEVIDEMVGTPPEDPQGGGTDVPF